MMKKIGFLFLLGISIVLVGCNGNNNISEISELETINNESGSLQIEDVDITMDDEKVEENNVAIQNDIINELDQKGKIEKKNVIIEKNQDLEESSELVLENKDESMEKTTKATLKIGTKKLTVNLQANSATEKLVEKLKEGNIIINAREYGGFEKVGNLGFDLPRTDKQITTNPGDIVLYQGNQVSLFYESNSWSYTPIGTIKNISQSELKEILGDDVDLILSL